MTQETRERAAEVQTEEQEESALDSLLEKVNLDSPLEIPLDNGKILTISREQLKYYLPKDATEAEVTRCLNETRVAELNPAVRGDCHYPRFNRDQPLRLFAGYPVYLRKAYENGLEHIAYEFTEDEDGNLFSIITTLEIKGREKPHVWETWYKEVVGMTGDKINWRWQKAPRSQLRKCGFVDNIRYSGLLSIPLPYIPEEMGRDEIADGYRNLTQPQLDAYEEKQQPEEASLGEVNAATHQIDMSKSRKKYHAMLKEAGLEFESDEHRQKWQGEMLGAGKEFSSSWEIEDYVEIFVVLREIIQNKGNDDPDPDPPQGQEPEETKSPVEELAESFQKDYPTSIYADARTACSDAAEAMFINLGPAEEWLRETYNKEPGELDLEELSDATARLIAMKRENDAEEAQSDSKQSPEMPESDGPDGEFFTSKETKKKLRGALLAFEDNRYSKGIGTVTFQKKASEILEEEVTDINTILDSDALLILRALQREVVELTGETTEDFIDPDNKEENSTAPEPEEKEEELGEEKDYLDLYLTKAGRIFGDNTKRRSWERHSGLPDMMIAKWPKDQLMRGYALLEGVEPHEEVVEDDPETITQEQIEDIKQLIHGMPERFHGSIGSEEFKDFCKKIVGKRKPLNELTEREASDIILQMKDVVQDEIARQKDK